MRGRRLLVVVVALLALGVPVARADGTGSIGIRLLDAPTNRVDDPRAKVYIVDHVAPGTTISRRVEVSNATDGTQTISTYAAAASIKDGTFRFGDGHARNELSTWTTVEPSTANFAPGDKQPVTVTIAVPKDASEGERYEVIWASVASAAPNGGGVSEVNRVGVRVYLSVGPGGEPASDFKITSLTALRRNGTPIVTATVKNTGGRAVDLSGSLVLTDGPGGLRAGPFRAKLGTSLGIGASDAVTVTLDKAIPAGPWKAKLSLESGLTKRSASATLTFPKVGSKTVTPESGSNLVVRAVEVSVPAAAVVSLLFFVRRRRRTPATRN